MGSLPLGPLPAPPHLYGGSGIIVDAARFPGGSHNRGLRFGGYSRDVSVGNSQQNSGKTESMTRGGVRSANGSGLSPPYGYDSWDTLEKPVPKIRNKILSLREIREYDPEAGGPANGSGLLP